jgi:hypothetical protein
MVIIKIIPSSTANLGDPLKADETYKKKSIPLSRKVIESNNVNIDAKPNQYLNLVV